MTEQTLEPFSILLVDDDPEVRSTLKLLLDMDKHVVTEACDGRQALDLFSSGKFDLVITDYVMPEMSGDQLAVEIKQQDPTLPIVMITANADLLSSPVPGVDCLLPKPFPIADLRMAIRSVARVGTPK
jgi:CheY-like chemotaxis protein